MTGKGERRRQRLDLRGVPCPVTWARAKAVLESLPAGFVVEIVTDDARSVRDIPRAAEAEGYAVIGSSRVPGGASILEIER